MLSFALWLDPTAPSFALCMWQLIWHQPRVVMLARHSGVRDLLGELLDETCTNVCLEPVLKPIDGEQLRQSTNTAEDARLDIKAGGFWSANECAYFDVRVFYPHARSYQHRTLEQLYRSQEQDKRRDYKDRVRNVERGTFTPFVFSATGGAGPAAPTQTAG